MNTTIVVATALAATIPSGVETTFHFMQIEQVIGGVNGDTSAQAIQLRMRSLGQNMLAGGRLRVHDAEGANPVLLIDLTTSVPSGAAGARVLITSAAFDQATTPAAVPDFTLTNLIPESYLPAGSMTFENDSGLTIFWRLSWGGDDYTGSTLGACTNDDSPCPGSGEFGPPWPGPLPSDGVQALQFQGPFNAPSTNNADDYELTSGPSVWVNNAGANFALLDSDLCPWDCGGGGDGDVGIVDFLALLAEWDLVDTPCDFDGGGVGIVDFLKLLANWGPCL